MKGVAMLIQDILIRLAIAVFVSAVIGTERENKNRPAGIRTHILVCVGATLIALMQDQINYEARMYALSNPQYMGIVQVDQVRLIAQVVSGIGFLGAGTIVVTKQSIQGLTTAATIWAVACLGLAIGVGYYEIALIGFAVIWFALTIVKRLIGIKVEKRLEVKYQHRLETKQVLEDFFINRKINIKDSEFSVEGRGSDKIYFNSYDFELPKGMTPAEIVEDLSRIDSILSVRVIGI
ncbi:MgtC/SapB family protein [Hutsoniella sourekii]|uniref:MgtC/SapB family protein n=1 Tax=Hutsoniella sourekii TaxID=87650 RepID=UPI0004890E2A|nr:MgtC/SapB family protein [Hutsoniella sourekii]